MFVTKHEAYMFVHCIYSFFVYGARVGPATFVLWRQTIQRKILESTWGCPIDVVLKVLLKTIGRQVTQFNKVEMMYIKMCEIRQNNIWIWYSFWFVCNTWYFWILLCVVNFCYNVNLKHGIFKMCFRQNAKCKMTARTGSKYQVFVKFCNLDCISPSKPRFSSSDNFFVFSV